MHAPWRTVHSTSFELWNGFPALMAWYFINLVTAFRMTQNIQPYSYQILTSHLSLFFLHVYANFGRTSGGRIVASPCSGLVSGPCGAPNLLPKAGLFCAAKQAVQRRRLEPNLALAGSPWQDLGFRTWLPLPAIWFPFSAGSAYTSHLRESLKPGFICSSGKF